MRIQQKSVDTVITWALSPLLFAIFVLGFPVILMMMFGDWFLRTISRYESEYSPWFAWRPVRHWNGQTWFWLERINRRKVGLFEAFYEELKEPDHGN